jgi:hypothetical protein
MIPAVQYLLSIRATLIVTPYSEMTKNDLDLVILWIEEAISKALLELIGDGEAVIHDVHLELLIRNEELPM